MKHVSEITKLIFFVTTVLFISFSSCNKDDEIAYTYVDIYIDINRPEFISLNSVGNYEYITGGVNGIIVYRTSVDQFMAYDRTCTYQPENNCRVSADQSNNFAECKECCNSAFLLLDGSVTHGPATKPLKQYQTTFDGTTIHIFN